MPPRRSRILTDNRSDKASPSPAAVHALVAVSSGGTQLQGARFDGAKLQGASLDGVQLKDAELKNANVFRSEFVDVNLDNAVVYNPDYEKTIPLPSEKVVELTDALVDEHCNSEHRLADSAQMRLAQDDEMVHTLAPDRSDQPFGKAFCQGEAGT